MKRHICGILVSLAFASLTYAGGDQAQRGAPQDPGTDFWRTIQACEDSDDYAEGIELVGVEADCDYNRETGYKCLIGCDYAVSE